MSSFVCDECGKECKDKRGLGIHYNKCDGSINFECKFCIKVIEVNDPTPPFCTCCGNLMIRIWSSTPVHFKGTGFYSTGG